jgi:hypothetical protein
VARLVLAEQGGGGRLSGGRCGAAAKLRRRHGSSGPMGTAPRKSSGLGRSAWAAATSAGHVEAVATADAEAWTLRSLGTTSSHATTTVSWGSAAARSFGGREDHSARQRRSVLCPSDGSGQLTWLNDL